MAHYAKHLSFLLLILVSLEHIDARESKFFSKVTHSSNNIVSVSESPLLAPTPAPAPAPASPAPAPLMAENGYGLYGHGSTETTPTTVNTIANDENEVPAEELDNLESYKESNTGYSYNNNNGYSNYKNNNNGYSNYKNNNNGYSNYNNNNNGYNTNTNSYGNDGYETGKQGMSDTRYLENGKYYHNVENQNTNTNSYGNNGYETGKQGMSDTRYLENGKYYQNVENQNNYYQNGYESVKESGNNNEGYNYGTNAENSNEFNTMEEYERQQGYPQTQGEYVP